MTVSSARVAAERHRTGSEGDPAPLACVLGGMDIVSPLGRAGIRCAVAVGRDDPVRFSNRVDAVIDRIDPRTAPGEYVDRLVEWARSQPVPPVLYYPTDPDLLLVSRYRARLREAFRFVIPDARLVEDLADKERFRVLAEGLGLPVPPSYRAAADDELIDDHGLLAYPVIVKPVVHGAGGPFRGKAKAVRVESPAELHEVHRGLRNAGVDCVVQALVPGPESRVESYHAFVDENAATVGEFTGVKVRTVPAEYGASTAIRVGRRADVLEAGRQIVSTLELRPAVVKVDFKRGPDGRLWLLEVNPRFNLWHNPGAAAGANLPTLVYAHLTGRPEPPRRPFRPGTRWCDVRDDRRGCRTAGLPLTTSLLFALRSETSSFGGLADPMPLLRGRVLPAVRRRVARVARKAPVRSAP